MTGSKPKPTRSGQFNMSPRGPFVVLICHHPPKATVDAPPIVALSNLDVHEPRHSDRGNGLPAGNSPSLRFGVCKDVAEDLSCVLTTLNACADRMI